MAEYKSKYTGAAIDAGIDKANAALPRAGGTMTGPLILSGDPESDLDAATKQYVDAAVANAEAGGSGGVSSWNDLTDKPFGEEYTEAYILPETTVNNGDGAEFLIVNPLGGKMAAGESYSVAWNGTQYSCTAHEVDLGGIIMTALGNTDVLMESGDTGEPFAFFVVPDAFIAETGAYAMVMILDGSASALISVFGPSVSYKTIDPNYLPPEGNSTLINGAAPHSLRVMSANPETGEFSLALGAASKASGDYACALGTQSASEGAYSVTEGYMTTASDNAAHAEGCRTVASGFASHAEGGVDYNQASFFTTASGDYSHAEGTQTTAGGVASHAEGRDTKATGPAAHAEGDATTASGSYSHAEGHNTTAGGFHSHAEGYGTKAAESAAHAEGYSAEALGLYSHAEGYGTKASGYCQHVQGKYNVEDTTGKYLHIVGNGESNLRSNAHTVDRYGNGWFAGDVFIRGTAQDSNARKLVANGDQQLILASPNGTKYSITVSDSGELSAAAVSA